MGPVAPDQPHNNCVNANTHIARVGGQPPPWPPADLAAGRARVATICAFNRHRPIESNLARRTATGEHVCTYPTRSRASTGERRGRVRVFVTGGGRYAQQTRRLEGADRKPRTAASSSWHERDMCVEEAAAAVAVAVADGCACANSAAELVPQAPGKPSLRAGWTEGPSSSHRGSLQNSQRPATSTTF